MSGDGHAASRPKPTAPAAAAATAAAIFTKIKTEAGSPPFLQTVSKKGQATSGKSEPKLTRVAFKVSRLMEFCTQRELVNQTGHAVQEWPLVVAKELLDNSLDACEESEVAPVITVTVEPGLIVVEDNGGGIEPNTVGSVLDYTVRVSSREAYCSPSRGAQGNALKTILAMGFVLDRERGSPEAAEAAEAVGVTVIEARGVRHRIEFRVDHVNNQPKIVHTTEPSPVMVGTRFAVHWPPEIKLLEPFVDGPLTRIEQTVGRYMTISRLFCELVEAYVWFNPHLSLRGVFFGREFVNVAATRPEWEKWRPRNPTSAHWYDPPRLQRYLAAHVARDRDLGNSRTVRAFLAEFRGLSGTAIQRRVLDEVGCSHQTLAAFFGVDKVNRAGVDKLLEAMKRHSKPVNPDRLGIIGAAHFRERFLAADGNADTFKYQLRKGTSADAIPYVVEFGFGLHQSALTSGGAVLRKIVTGANFSAAISNPFRRFGATGEGLDATLTKVRANATAPVICALHLASARLQFADRGKSSIILTDDAEQPDD